MKQTTTENDGKCECSELKQRYLQDLGLDIPNKYSCNEKAKTSHRLKKSKEVLLWNVHELKESMWSLCTAVWAVMVRMKRTDSHSEVSWQALSLCHEEGRDRSRDEEAQLSVIVSSHHQCCHVWPLPRTLTNTSRHEAFKLLQRMFRQFIC